MRLLYDIETNTLTITLRDVPVKASEEERSGVIPDCDADGLLVGLEILAASRRATGPTSINFEVVSWPTERAAAS